MKLGSQGWDSDVEILSLARNPKVVQNCINVTCNTLLEIFEFSISDISIFKSQDVR